MKENENEPGLEERFRMIEEILEQMEQDDVTLEQSFELYKKGLTQIQAANESLDGIEHAMLVLNEEGKLEEF